MTLTVLPAGRPGQRRDDTTWPCPANEPSSPCMAPTRCSPRRSRVRPGRPGPNGPGAPHLRRLPAQQRRHGLRRGGNRRAVLDRGQRARRVHLGHDGPPCWRPAPRLRSWPNSKTVATWTGGSGAETVARGPSSLATADRASAPVLSRMRRRCRSAAAPDRRSCPPPPARPRPEQPQRAKAHRLRADPQHQRRRPRPGPHLRAARQQRDDVRDGRDTPIPWSTTSPSPPVTEPSHTVAKEDRRRPL